MDFIVRVTYLTVYKERRGERQAAGGSMARRAPENAVMRRSTPAAPFAFAVTHG
jgi:hypothetical protein